MANFPHFRYSHPMRSTSFPFAPLGTRLHRLIVLTALPLAMLLAPGTGWAADTPAAALRVLLGASDPSQPAAAPSAAPHSDPAQRRTITVMRGETLDRAIRRALPNLPLHPDFLRQAFVRVNPQVFPKGAPHNLRTGTPLQVPTADELRYMLVSQYPETVSLFQLVEAAKTAEPEPAQARRHWVRYP